MRQLYMSFLDSFNQLCFCFDSTELCEVAETEEAVAAVPIQYQCLECLALFDTAELWMAHRQTHKISTHSNMSDTVSIHTFLIITRALGWRRCVARTLAHHCWDPGPNFSSITRRPGTY